MAKMEDQEHLMDQTERHTERSRHKHSHTAGEEGHKHENGEDRTRRCWVGMGCISVNQ